MQLLADLNRFSFQMYTVPVTVAILTILFVSSTRLKGRFHKRLFFGLIAMFVGDVMATFIVPESGVFLKSMIWRALAYVFFISAFYLDFRSAPELDKKVARIAILVALICSFSIYLYLRPFLGAHRIPVLIYTFVLSSLAMMASFRRLRVNRKSFVLILCGTIVLIASDILMAVHKFVVPFAAAVPIVGATHILALCLIVIGGVKRMLLIRQSGM